MSSRFEVLATCGPARRGRLTTAHGTVETPAFMPVGTRGAVKGMTAQELEAAGAALCLDSHSLDGEVLARAIESLTADPERLTAMAEAASSRARPDAAAALVDESVALLESAR